MTDNLLPFCNDHHHELSRTKVEVSKSEALSTLLGKYRLWAARRNIPLEGSKVERGLPVYTRTLEENLFEPLSPVAYREYQDADGQELRTSKCRALHSSSMAFTNATHYLRRIGRLDLLAKALRVPSVGIKDLRYEEKMMIDTRFGTCPNLDGHLVGTTGNDTFLEAKLTEPLGRPFTGFPAKYHNLIAVWDDIPNLKALSHEITGDTDPCFSMLHVKQLICHVLGIKSAIPDKARWRLVLLYLDLPNECGAELRREIDYFKEVCKADGIHFQSATYQQLILRLAEHRSEHPHFIDYLSERYL